MNTNSDAWKITEGWTSIEDLVVNVDVKPVPKLTFDIRITWCGGCNLKAQAAALVTELMTWLNGHNMTFELVEGSNSVFKVECNGQTVFERAKEGRFPLYHEIQLRIFRRFLRPENLQEAAQTKWNRILEAKGLTWEQVYLQQSAPDLPLVQ